ncbi:hypothetical protein SAMN05216515_12918 [Eubacterium pyruvativorans]|uniref:Membrane transporter protein n=1 Tax=Eubacterium pyruvativorans TaxID=155865 RepID=A0A1I7HXB9_9FIRM|nr:permease [Eubacterium pyruvativorans]MDO5568243.1 permease [Eubacteriales bacterium]MCI5746335.1 permease [Eubacterium pyruvativorans]MDD6708184.1 permease [Eubacterium pyruvativorans]MDD7684476.1 permease [Eubacterium pyruvativorans]MDY4049773.1 permease [Eubacterium pyruvativorans]
MNGISAVTIMKALCVIGFILDAILVFRDVQKKRSTEEGRAVIAESKKHWKWNAMVGLVANFFDTLGIGSFAPSSAAFKIGKSVDDINVPGTLNVGDTFPVLAEAFLFFNLVEMDTLTLALMLVAATVGAFVGADIVTKWNVRMVRYGMGIGLLILGVIMAMKAAQIGPFGITGAAVGLRGVKLVAAVVINFFLGALMNLGVGLYAPCMALCAILGMNVQVAFPVMMGSCAYLMAFGNTPKFISASRYDVYGVITQGIFGVIGVTIAYVFVKNLPLTVLTWLVICVVLFTSFLFFKDAVKTPKAVKEN